MMRLKHFSLHWLLLFAVALASCMPVKFEPGTGYEVRGDKVYYSRYEGGYQRNAVPELISEADARTFHIFDQFGYARDAQHVYYEGKAISNAEAATFEILGCRYARDQQQVYFYGKVLEGAQVASFKVIGPRYALELLMVAAPSRKQGIGQAVVKPGRDTPARTHWALGRGANGHVWAFDILYQ